MINTMRIPNILNQTRFLGLISALGLSAWGLFLRFKNLAGRELWGDEIYQYKMSVGPFKQLWKINNYGDLSAFPGDYVLTYPFVQWFGLNKWGLAIPHIIFSFIGFLLLYFVCRKYYKTAVGFIVAFAIVGFNQHLIFHSFEFRPYGVLATLALGSFYLMEVCFLQFNELSRLKKISIGIFFILTCWYHVFGLLIVLFPLFYFFLSVCHREGLSIFKKPYVQYILIVLTIAFPVWLYYAFGNHYGFSRQGLALAAGRNTFDYIPNPLNGFWRFFNYTVFYHLIGIKNLYFLLGGFVFLAIIPFFDKAKKFGFFLCQILLPITTILVIVLMNQYWFLIRQYIFLAPLMAFFLGWVWDSSIVYYLDKDQRRWSPRSIIGLICLVGCSTAGIIGIFVVT